MDSKTDRKLKVEYVPLSSLHHPEKNPRHWSDEVKTQVKESIARYGVVDPLVVNDAPGREGIILGGNLRWEMLKELGHETVPVVHITIADPKREAELIIRLNKNVASFDIEALAEFDEAFLADIGFDSEELDDVFKVDEQPESFDLKKELAKLDIQNVEIQKGDVYEFPDGSRLMCGDSCIEEDMLTLMDGAKADLCLTDPPYILDYLHGKKRRGKATEGFGLRRDRKYLETDELPPDFTDQWMANIAKIQKPDFSIIVYENPKNLRTIWNALEKYWKYRNTIVWHVPNRVQGFSAKYKFFNKADIALVGTSGDVSLNKKAEDELFQTEYENALFATSGKPTWESYEKGKRYCPTDFISHVASDRKSSGQGVVFGTKPLEILIPYIKVLTKRGDLVVEPFGGSGSTGAAAMKLGRVCRTMEKVPAYAEVIKSRWEKIAGKAKKIHGR